MTKTDRLFLLTTGLLLVSIPILYEIKTSVPTETVTVLVEDRKWMKGSHRTLQVPKPSKHGGTMRADMPLPEHWQVTVKIKGRERKLRLAPEDRDKAHADKLEVSYQILRDGSFRVVSISVVEE